MKTPRLVGKSGRFPIYKTVPNPESKVGKFTKEGIAKAMMELAKATTEINDASSSREPAVSSQEK